MTDSSLQDDLLAIPGVEGAEVEGSADKPAGLRIRIAEGADQHAVGGAIRRVLTAHGLGTDTRLPGEAPTSAPVAVVPDDAEQDAGFVEGMSDSEALPSLVPASVAIDDGDVIDLTDASDPFDHGSDEADDPVQDRNEAQTDQGTLIEGDGDVVEALADDEIAPVVADIAPPTDLRADRSGIARIASVAVEEGRDGIVVTVTASDGSAVRQPAASTEGGVESAVVRATAKLAFPDAPEAIVIDVEDRRVEGVDIVMIVLDVNGTVQAGSAVVGAGRAFALGRATWAALQL